MQVTNSFLSKKTQLTLLLLFFISTLALMIWPAWQWCFMALVAASLGHPVVNGIGRVFHLGRSGSVGVLILFLTMLLLVPVVMLGLSLDMKSIPNLQGWGLLFEQGQAIFYRAMESLAGIVSSFVPVDPASLTRSLSGVLKSLSGVAGRGVTGILGAGPELATDIFIFLVTFYYALVNFPKLRKKFLGLPVFDLRFKSKFLRSFSDNAYSSVIAAGGTALTQALVLGIGMLTLGFSHWLMATVVAFFAAFIPVIGTMPISAVVVIQFAVQGSVKAALIMFAIAAIAGVSDNVVRPMLLKGSGNMHPWLALISVLGGLSVFGIWGLFIGPITAGLLKTTWSEWLCRQDDHV